MDDLQRQAYEEGRRDAERLYQLVPGFARVDPNWLDGTITINDDIGCLVRVMTTRMIAAAESPLFQQTDDSGSNFMNLMAVSSAMEMRKFERAVHTGALDDQLPEQAREGDEFYARGYFDFLVERRPD